MSEDQDNAGMQECRMQECRNAEMQKLIDNE